MKRIGAGMILLAWTAGCVAPHERPPGMESRQIVVEPEHDATQNHPNRTPNAELEVEEATLAGSEVELEGVLDDE